MCVFGRVKHTMHVVSPPRVDSGTTARPVSKSALASETVATAGWGSPDTASSETESELGSSGPIESSSGAAAASCDGDLPGVAQTKMKCA